WMTDITYIPMPRGFVYLVALIDVHSRYLVAWELSNSLDADFCLTMLKKALQRQKPEIINSDQGSQFTSKDWVKTVENADIQISMDGKGRCLDNVYIERFWRALKYEDMYVNPPQNMNEARQIIARYIEFYNNERFHQSLKYKVPAELYFQSKRKRLMDTVDNSGELPTVSTARNNNSKPVISLDNNSNQNEQNINSLN
ncbi:MAG: IS3 family transposase, partial [Planctomycetes bacterium]|nr:IS3 family transposase [Planctomycetota bacterium]